MGEIIFSIFLAAMLSTCIAQVFSNSDTYRGAVVEYSPVTAPTDKLTTMAANVNNYVMYMKEAADKKADIIVFPEGGLFSGELSFIPNPDDRIAPCDSTTFVTTEAVKTLSRASKSNKIYSVINLREKRNCTKDDEDCPAEGYFTYNTNVVFDREGVVIARYSKYNLFDEPKTHHTKNPELVFFDTDFGVRFGTFTCFDILFSTPAQKLVQQFGIKDFVFTTFWFSELPFLTALQAQRGWAESNNVNLLASGVNLLVLGSAGSGIYNGKYGHILQVMPEKKTSKLLVADIPKFKDSCHRDVYKRGTYQLSRVNDNSFNSSHFSAVKTENVEDAGNLSLALLKDQIYLYSSAIIKGGQIFEKTVCSKNDFCCDFYVDMDALLPESEKYTYRAMVLNGVRKFGQTFRGGIQSCGIVMCDGPNIANCTSRVKNTSNLFKFKAIRIKGNFKLRNSYQFPSTLTDRGELLPLPVEKYDFSMRKTSKSIEVSMELIWPVTDLYAFAIYGRDFTRDMEPMVPESKASVLVSAHILLVTFLASILFAR